MVQPEKDNPKENPLPSLPGENTKVRFLLPVTQKPSAEPSAAQQEPHIPQVLMTTHHVRGDKHNPGDHQHHPVDHHHIHGDSKPNVDDSKHNNDDQHIPSDWIIITGRKSTQKPKTSNYWIKGTSIKSTQKLHTANAHVEPGTSKVPGSLEENVVFSIKSNH